MRRCEDRALAAIDALEDALGIAEIGEPLHRFVHFLVPAFQPVEQVMVGEMAPFRASLPLRPVVGALVCKRPRPVEPRLRDADLIDPVPQRLQPALEILRQRTSPVADEAVKQVGSFWAVINQVPGDLRP